MVDATQKPLQLQQKEQELSVILSKLQDLRMDQREQQLVLEAFNQFDDDRKCYRSVGGVLVERTVGTVRPVLQAHETKVGELMKSLEKDLSVGTEELRKLREQSMKQ